MDDSEFMDSSFDMEGFQQHMSGCENEGLLEQAQDTGFGFNMPETAAHKEIEV